jgi:hypothetical protein
MANNPDMDGQTVVRGDTKRYEVAIPTRNLSWEHLARYLELAFKGFKLQIPKDQKVSPPSRCGACICPAASHPMAACRVRVRGFFSC